MKAFLKKPVIITLLIFSVGGIFGIYLFINRTSAPAYEFITVQRRDLAQQVNVTGRVEPIQDVQLAFEKGGTVLHTFAEVGDSVQTGQTIVELDSSELNTQLLQQQAALESEQAKLAELHRGTRTEEVQIQKVKVANAKTALADTIQNLIDKINDAYTKADDAIRNNVDPMYIDPRSQTPKLNFIAKSSQLTINLEWSRLLLEERIVSWNMSLASLTKTSDISIYSKDATLHLIALTSFLDQLAFTVNEATPASLVTQTMIDSWKTNISTARTNINTAANNITLAEEKFRNANSNLILAKQELTLQEAGTAPEQVTAQEAHVKKAKANVQNYQVQIKKMTLKTPIAGVITQQDAKVGEIITANTPMVSVISESQFQIEASVPEADITKINIGDIANITLDAYGRDIIFQSITTKIDPGETIIDGIPTYKVTFQFLKPDTRIKPGMTANIDITTATRKNILAIPQRALIRQSGNKFVRILAGAEVQQIQIETGLQASDGNIEILRGLTEGDKVITFFPE
jgi:RND family efflux transporter MFP subunit